MAIPCQLRTFPCPTTGFSLQKQFPSIEKWKTLPIVIALLFFLNNGLQAQTSSDCPSMACIKNVNVSLDGDCYVELTASMLLRGFKHPDSHYQIEVRDANGYKHPNLFDESDAGKTFKVSVLNPSCNDMSCWGNVKIENKNVPITETSTLRGMCGQPNLTFEKLEDIIYRINKGCGVPIFDITEEIENTGDKCDGEQIVRTVRGSADFDGRVRKVTLRIDTILYTPLSTIMITCPYGEDSADPIILECADVEAYPDPELIEDLLGIRYAYPYIYKGLDSTQVIQEKDSIRETISEEKVRLENGAWAIFDVIKKDTIPYMDTSYTYEPIYLPVKEGVTCNLSAKYVDESYPNCLGEGYKVKRTWTIIDWCGSPIKDCEQWINVIDTIPPVWKTPMADANVNIAPWSCQAAYDIPTPDIWDECADYDVTWYTAFGILNNNTISGLRFEDSPVRVIGKAIDKCGNESLDTFYINVMDMTAPVAIALDQINVSLTGDPATSEGIAKLYASNVDVESHDSNCGEVELCVLLKEELESPIIRDGVHLTDEYGNPIYSPAQCVTDGVYEYRFTIGKEEYLEEIPYVICKDHVKFCCENLGVNNVALVVTDQGGKQGFSWSEVLVEDKTNTGWACFSERISCEYVDDFIPERLPAFGGILCEVYDIREIARVEELQCGTGYIEITYGAYLLTTDELVSQTTCIYPIFGGSTFNPYEIKWPKHYDGSYYTGYFRECELVAAEGLDASDPDNYYPGIVEHLAEIPMGDAQDCFAGDDTGEPIWCGSTCGLIGSSYEIDSVSTSDACYKLIKRWTIIDWCTWVPNEDGLGDDTNDTYVDQFMATDDEWLIQAGIENAFTDYRRVAYSFGGSEEDEHGGSTDFTITVPAAACESCEKPSGDADPIYFRYTDVYMDGYYTYDQVIKIVDDVEPEVYVNDTDTIITDGNQLKVDVITDETFADCFTSHDVTATAVDMCGEIDLADVGASWIIDRSLFNKAGELVSTARKVTTGNTVTMNTGDGKPTWYSIIKWRVEDGCGNIGFGESRHDFRDGKNPTPVCYQDLSTATMNTDGTVAIWAIDYDLGSFDNCSEVEVYFKDDDGNKVQSLEFNCDDLGDNVLRMYVSDEYGNEDFCEVSLRIDDNTGICDNQGASALIGGMVTTEYGEAIESARVSLDNDRESLTPLEGNYAFSSNDVFQNYKITSYKNDDHLNGVTSIDLVLIQKHILGLEELDSPYKLIAADVNNDKKVSALDILEMRKLILGVNKEFSENLSWRFVDANQEFEDPKSPWPFTELLEIENLQNNKAKEDFIGVKIGDINGNVIANSALDAEGRSTDRVVLQLENQKVKIGQQVVVPVRAQDFESMVAMQMTWEMADLHYNGIESGRLEISNDQVANLASGTMTMAWHEVDGVTLQTKDEVLFTLYFTATADLTLQDAITITSNVTEAIAYDSHELGAQLQLEFSSNDAGSLDFVLLQNQPNPFAASTKIGFVLPQPSEATVKVFDITSKLILEIEGSYNAGYNEIMLSREQLNASGVLYYQLESGDHIATRKMVLVQ